MNCQSFILKPIQVGALFQNRDKVFNLTLKNAVGEFELSLQFVSEKEEKESYNGNSLERYTTLVLKDIETGLLYSGYVYEEGDVLTDMSITVSTNFKLKNKSNHE